MESVVRRHPESGVEQSGGTFARNQHSYDCRRSRRCMSVNANLNFNGGVWRFNCCNGANLFAAGSQWWNLRQRGPNCYTNNDILAVTVQSGGALTLIIIASPAPS